MEDTQSSAVKQSSSDNEPITTNVEDDSAAAVTETTKKDLGRADMTDEDAEEEPVEEILSPKELEDRVARASELKTQGNKLYSDGDYTEACALYTEALDICPDKHETLSALFANRAACKLKLEQFEDTVNDCTSALEIRPVYTKVTLRRAMASEKLERYDDALEDYNTVLKQEPKNEIAASAVKRLPALAEAQKEKLKDEMLGNLKKLGNMCLRPFGLSTDNFQMVQDPNTGGYSVNFQQNAPGGQRRD